MREKPRAHVLADENFVAQMPDHFVHEAKADLRAFLPRSLRPRSARGFRQKLGHDHPGSFSRAKIGPQLRVRRQLRFHEGRRVFRNGEEGEADSSSCSTKKWTRLVALWGMP